MRCPVAHRSLAGRVKQGLEDVHQNAQDHYCAEGGEENGHALQRIAERLGLPIV
jgi:hypothetical protein